MKIGRIAGFLLGMSLVCGTLTATDNLVPDPGFAKANFAPLAKGTTWLSYVIVSPSKTVLNKDGSVTLTGGKTFLHSSKFAVNGGAKYSYSLTVKGTGKVWIETLWWTKDDSMAKPHRTFSVKAVELKNGETKTITGDDTASKNAAKAYIRVVVENGTITVSKPVVSKK